MPGRSRCPKCLNVAKFVYVGHVSGQRLGRLLASSSLEIAAMELELVGVRAHVGWPRAQATHGLRMCSAWLGFLRDPRQASRDNVPMRHGKDCLLSLLSHHPFLAPSR